MQFIHAKREMIRPDFICMVEIDESKVEDIMRRLALGQQMPAVVAVRMDETNMPLDGHHRMKAHDRMGLMVHAFTVGAREFEDLDLNAQNLCPPKRAEDLILCDGVPAMEYAHRWMLARVQGDQA